jgi:hypothetical protein
MLLIRDLRSQIVLSAKFTDTICFFKAGTSVTPRLTRYCKHFMNYVLIIYKFRAFTARGARLTLDTRISRLIGAPQSERHTHPAFNIIMRMQGEYDDAWLCFLIG